MSTRDIACGQACCCCCLTELKPCPCAQMKQLQPGQLLKLPSVCPAVAARIFYACTQQQPEQRPSALDVVNWLRDDDSS